MRSGFLLLLAALVGNAPAQIAPRFTEGYILGGLPSIKVDWQNSYYGIAHQMARAAKAQARILWVDGTANLDRVSDDAKVTALMRQVKAAGFNTVVFDVKPISGQVLYPSQYAPKIEEWKGKKLPRDYDPLAKMATEAKANGLSFFVSLNSFSEGHNLFKAGPGYNRVLEQTVIYDSKPIIVSSKLEEGEHWMYVNPKVNGQLSPNTCTLFSSREALPKDECIVAVLDSKGKVVAVEEDDDGGRGNTPLPRGGAFAVFARDTEFAEEFVFEGVTLTLRDEARFIPISDRPELQYPLMMNPHHPKVREYMLKIITEITDRYPVDGIIFDDRLRYAGLYADFSPVARTEFDKVVGKNILWPDDVFRVTYTQQMKRGIRPGPYFERWLSWRSQTMQKWLGEVRSTLRKSNPEFQLGVYAGSWYGDYQQFGNNYASPEFDAGFWFLTSDYRRTGFADELDFLITGCYYPTATIYEAMETGEPIGRSVEAAGQLSNRAARDMTWTYAGISLDQFSGNPEGLANALQAACATTQGVMVFDLSHNIEPMWSVFTKAFSKPAKAPHTVLGLLDRVRAQRKAFDRMGVKERTVPISAGSSGVGF